MDASMDPADGGTHGTRRMLRLDHLTVLAPSLREGVEHVRHCLGIDMPPGGAHPEMGTHNHLLRLGDDIYMEVIAVDPAAPPPAGPRWFGLGAATELRSRWERGERLRGWVARTDDLDAALRAHGDLLGGCTQVSRGGRHSRISLPADGSLPMDGVLPSVIERRGPETPAEGLPDLGTRLVELVLEHPEPDTVAALYRGLGIADPPEIRFGPKPRYVALIATAAGPRTLT